MKTEYAIVGIGLIDSLGADYKKNWARYLSGHCPMRKITNFDLDNYPVIKASYAFEIDNDQFDPSTLFSNLEIKNLDRYYLFGTYVVDQALRQCNIKDYNATGVIFSSLGGGMTSMFNATQNLINAKKTSPRAVLAAQRDNLTGTISKKFNLLGPTVNMTSACSSGIYAIDYAIKLLEDEVCEQIIVGASDVMVDPMDVYMFQSIGALDVRDPAVSNPFDVNRQGIVIGEGAAAFVIKSKNKAIEDGDDIKAIIKGIGLGTEIYHETSMSKDGTGAKLVIDRALAKSKLETSEIRLINAHATSTVNGDDIEYNVIKDYFPNADVMALKANIGHTMAASALVELIYMIESLNNNIIGPVANLLNPIGTEISLPKSAKKIDSKYGLKNSFGFGGKSAAIIIERV